MVLAAFVNPIRWDNQRLDAALVPTVAMETVAPFHQDLSFRIFRSGSFLEK